MKKHNLINTCNSNTYVKEQEITDEFKEVDLVFEEKKLDSQEKDNKETMLKEIEENKNCSFDEKNDSNYKEKSKIRSIQLEEEKFISIKSNTNTENMRMIIKFNEAWNYFLSCNLDNEKKRILTEDFTKHNCFKKLFLLCQNKLELNKDLKDERDILFSSAKCELNYENEVHFRILTSLYKNINSPQDKSNYDWMSIGFQSNEPKTDLRGAGMLGLLQMLYFTETFNGYSKELLEYSKNPLFYFPFACLLLNATMISLEALREGDLIEYCNKKKSIITTINEFYCGIIIYFGYLYRKDFKTMNDISKMIAEINSYSKNNIENIFNFYKTELNKCGNDIKDSASLSQKL